MIYSIISVVIGGGIVLLTYPYVGLTTSAYIAIPVVAPIALTGFYSYNGMTFIEMMKLKLHFSFGNKALSYISTESADEIRKVLMTEETGSKSSANKSLIVMLVAVLTIVGLFVAAAVILKMYM